MGPLYLYLLYTYKLLLLGQVKLSIEFLRIDRYGMYISYIYLHDRLIFMVYMDGMGLVERSMPRPSAWVSKF